MKFVIEMGTDMCGTDAQDFLEFEDGVSQESIDQQAWEMALQHAESYFAVYECGEEPDEDEEGDGDRWITTDQVWYTVTPWNEDQHGPWPGDEILA